MHFDYIIVASDLSDHAGAAVRWASTAQQYLGAKIIVVHVVELSVRTWVANAVKHFQEDPTALKRAEERLTHWYQDMAGTLPDEAHVMSGSVREQLCELVGQLDGSCLLTIATTMRNKVEEFVHGSTVRSIVARPPCPVVVVHPSHDSVNRMRPILVGSDFSSNADKAIALAADAAQQMGMTLHILHANPPMPLELFGHTATQETRDAALNWSYEQFTLQEERIPGLADVEYETFVAEKHPAVSLANHARSIDASVMVVGHSGESELAQSVLGSVAQRCLNTMPCTLVIVPRA